jgi:peroxiredoxin
MMAQAPHNEQLGADRSFDDLGRVLQEEIGRLPKKYNAAVVLCYLEGLTHDQAADQLGWPVGTVRRRLAWARDRLRGRLTRRGLAPTSVPASLLGSGPVWESSLPAMAVPAALAEATVRGGLRIGLGNASLAGIVPAESVALMKGVLHTMMITKLTAWATTVLTAALVATGAGLMAQSGQGSGNKSAIARVTDQAQPQAGIRPADDQLDALLRQFDDASESMRKTAREGKTAAEKKALSESNYGKIQSVNHQLFELAARHPRTNAAEQALIWIVTHNSFEPEADKAWDFLARDYVRSDRLKQLLSRRLELHWASQAVEDLLRRALDKNPYREIRGLACFWLAEILRYRATVLRVWAFQSDRQSEMWRARFTQRDLERIEKQDPRSLDDEATRLYERVIAEFPSVENNDTHTERPPLVLGRTAVHLPDVASVHLNELRRLSVGNAAPEIEGIDLDGKPMKLSDYRGKIVVLLVGGFGRPYTAPPERAPAHIVGIFRQISRTVEGKSVAFLGVITTFREEYRKEAQASGLAIRFWWDPDQEGQPERGVVWGPKPGSILAAWNAETPNWYVIDSRGVIRHTHVFGPDMLQKAVAALLNQHENESDAAKKQ